MYAIKARALPLDPQWQRYIDVEGERVRRISGGGSLALNPAIRPQRIRRKVGSIAYNSGNTSNIPGYLPKAGYITALDLRSLIQIVTGATPPVVANYGTYGPIQKLQLVVGNRTPVNLPGFHANAYSEIFFAPYKDVLATNPVGASTTNNWLNDMRIPLTIDDDSELGAWYAQDQELNLDFLISGGAATYVFSTVNSATVNGSWDIYVERFSAAPPDAPGGWLKAISYYNELKLFGSFALKNGTTFIPIDRDRDYVRFMFVFYTGSTNDNTFAPAGGLFTTIELIVGDQQSIYFPMDEQSLKDEMIRVYGWGVNGSGGAPIRAGVYCIDLIRQKSRSLRDVLPTDSKVVDVVGFNIVSTSASNSVDIVTQGVMDNPFAQKWLQSAQAKGLLKAA